MHTHSAHSRGRIRAAWLWPVIPLLLLGTTLALPAEPVPAPPAKAPSACSMPIPDIYDQVSPAVVTITSTSVNPYEVTDRVTRAVGSGVIIDASGIILTNSHVVFGRQAIMVTLDDGTNVPAEVVGADPLFDIAVIRIPQPSRGKLPTAVLGDSGTIRVGEEVVAIGNPLGLEQTLTRGVVSAINRVLPDAPLAMKEPMIQTDAPINPGNSGGPLVNRCGEVIGITTAIVPEAQDIGFAIPSDLIRSVLPSLIKQGRIIRPWIGVQGQLVTPPLKALLRIPLVDGILVEVVEPGSPAERHGLRGGQLDVSIAGHAVLVGGDIITDVNGQPVGSIDKFLATMKTLKVGETVRLTLFRKGEVREVEFKIPERPIQPEDLPEQRSLAPMAEHSQGSRVGALRF